MTSDDRVLGRRALRAYDLGRLRLAARNAVFVAPLIALSMYGCGTSFATLLLGGALVLVVALFTWRGGAWRRALVPGVLAGLVPFAIPLVAEIAGGGCSGASCRSLEIACVLAGLWGGAVVGWSVPRRSDSWQRSLGATAVVTWLTGALGCFVLGALGLAGMGLAILIAAAPVAVLRRV